MLVLAPVSKLTITGNNWILQGNILELQISCQGSKPFQYCLNYFPGIYNVTGNETCINPLSLDNCNFNIGRYYGSPGSHTIVVIITNDVQKLITPITVTVYEGILLRHISQNRFNLILIFSDKTSSTFCNRCSSNI